MHTPAMVARSAPRLETARLALWLFLVSEALLFAGLIGAFLFLNTARADFGNDGGLLSVPMAASATVVLLASSWTASRLEQATQRAQVLRWWLATLLLGAGFLSFQAYEYVDLWQQGIAPQHSLYWGCFFLLTAVHGLHVLAGCLAFLGFGFSAWRASRATLALDLTATYWHFVDLVWLLLFFLLYLT